VQLVARADVELAEDLAQVPFDRPRADEQLRADLGVREAGASEAGDESLLCGQVVARVDPACPDGRARGRQLTRSPIREPVHADPGAHLVGDAQLAAGVQPAVHPSQPLAVDEVGAGELGADPGPAQMVDGFAEGPFGAVARQQGARAGFDAERPRGSGRRGLAGQPLERVHRQIGPPGPRRGLDELRQTPVLEDELSMFTGATPGRLRLLVRAEAVAEDRVGVGGHDDGGALASGAGVADRRIDQRSRLGCPAAPREQLQRGVRRRLRSRQLLHRCLLGDEVGGRPEVAPEDQDRGRRGQRPAELAEGAGAAGQLEVLPGQEGRAVVVPELEGEDDAVPRPAQALLGASASLHSLCSASLHTGTAGSRSPSRAT
jgi:hypothetical protein